MLSAFGLFQRLRTLRNFDRDEELSVILVAILIFRWGSQPREIPNHFGVIGTVQQIESVPENSDHALRENDDRGRLVVDLDHGIVELIADEGVAVAQADGAGGQI